MPYTRQGYATIGRPQYSSLMKSRTPHYYPKQPEAIPETPQEEPLTYEQARRLYIDQHLAPKYKTSLGPAADSDPSQGLPEGFSDPSGMPMLGNFNELGLASQKGDIKGMITHGARGLLDIATLPAQPILTMFDAAKKGIKGMLPSEAIPTNPLSGAQFASPTPGNPGFDSDLAGMSTDLSSIDMGGVSGNSGAGIGLGMGPGMEGGGGLMGFGGDDMGEW